jgi:CheY-like chemotaxis protein/anti-sigma regulatory factor (Ser/Thr protein kinase)
MNQRPSSFILRPFLKEAVMATVLVVDDSPVDRHRVGGLLQKHPGWVVVHASSGQETLAAIERQVPDVVLTDLRMPGMNGLELVEELKQKYPFLPVILITAFGSEEIALLALERGAASYVPKRNLSRQLHKTVQQVLEVVQAKRGHQRVLDVLTFSESHYVVDNDPSLIPHLIGHLRENLIGIHLCDPNEALRIGIALREALINAIHHGNLEVSTEILEENEQAYNELLAERSRQSPYRDRRVHVSVKETREEVTYVVRDEGPGFDPTRLPDQKDPASLEKSNERGLRLIRSFMDEVRHNATGNEITMVKRRRV